MQALVDIVLPADQLEGTSAVLSKWLIEVGAEVKQGDPIIELETDKVAMEICAISDGVLAEIVMQEGENVPVEGVLGRLSEQEQPELELKTEPVLDSALKRDNDNTAELCMHSSDDDAHKQSACKLVGPAVRRLLRQQNLELTQIQGTGRYGRVTLCDVKAYLAQVGEVVPQSISQKRVTKSPLSRHDHDARPLVGELVPHTSMRKSIAKHMKESLLHISPHVTSVFEMDMSNIIEHRKWHKKEFAELGVNLTFTAYFLSACAKALHAVPQVNARFHEEGLELFKDINIGVGTALADNGLVVPVVQQVQEMNLFEIAYALNQQTEKARTGKLKPNDMKNGTFTISNHGVSGSLFAAPIIINQPQVAILGIGKLDKRVVVKEVEGVDTMVIKPMCYVSLSMDHRALDAHQTNRFLQVFVEAIEQWG
ncbi:dihydrolipoamide succinyltransferase [Marinomonas sp. 42_23_T18]|nr:dihydrolipoamide succinyltransferase [Marinomonas sp. 42_23_T18]